MITLVGGAAALFIAWYVLSLFRNTKPAVLARALKVSGGVVSLGAAAFIGLRGNVIVAVPLGMFGLSLLGWEFGPAGFSARTRRGEGRQSKVRSAFLDMTLDHDTGALNGTVVAGSHAGRALSEFDRDGLLQLLREFDDESRQLLAGYLDRRFPDWREQAGADAPSGRAASSGKMTREEAYQILGLAPGANDAAIVAAHRNLMKRLHPDQGGSTYLASRVNEARDLLRH
jgi:hypothetical protein